MMGCVAVGHFGDVAQSGGFEVRAEWFEEAVVRLGPRHRSAAMHL